MIDMRKGARPRRNSHVNRPLLSKRALNTWRALLCAGTTGETGEEDKMGPLALALHRGKGREEQGRGERAGRRRGRQQEFKSRKVPSEEQHILKVTFQKLRFPRTPLTRKSATWRCPLSDASCAGVAPWSPAPADPPLCQPGPAA